MTRFLSAAFAAFVATSHVSALRLRPSNDISPIRRLEPLGFTLLGDSIYGTPSNGPGDVEFGTAVDISAFGGNLRLAVGARHHDWKTPDSQMLPNDDGGGVFLYDYSGDDWDLIWFLDGNPDERIGDRLSLSADGSRIAVRRYDPDSVEVYDISSNDTPTLSGTILSQDDGDDGNTVTLSPDGNRLAVSAESFQMNAGKVNVYEQQSGQWSLIGTVDGMGSAQDRFGWMTALSMTGDRLAISAPNHDGDGLMNRGLVRVYDYDSGSGLWNQVGSDLVGNRTEERFGFSMDLSADGSTLVIGSPNNDEYGMLSGKVSVYKLINGSWTPQGNEIPGAENGDRFGRSVAISDDGLRIAASSYYHDMQRGQVRMFELLGETWTQVGSDIDGDDENERLGFGLLSVAMTGDGLHLASGTARARNDDDDSTGLVNVWEALARPSAMPSAAPSLFPSSSPSASPSTAPSDAPSLTSSSAPSSSPSSAPSESPSLSPSSTPSAKPSGVPSASPSKEPSSTPSSTPTMIPSASPSAAPTESARPSFRPSAQPSSSPSAQPSTSPSASPSSSPSTDSEDSSEEQGSSDESSDEVSPSATPVTTPQPSMTTPSPNGNVPNGIETPTGTSSAGKGAVSMIVSIVVATVGVIMLY